jgi:hypothetical protein
MQNGCVRTKKRSHQTSCLVEDCSLRTRKVLCDHLHPTTNVSAMQGLLRKRIERRDAYLEKTVVRET